MKRPLPLTPQTLTNLQTLRERADDFSLRVLSTHGEHMTCTAGCSGCCQENRTLSPVEMADVLVAVETLSSGEQNRVMERAGQQLQQGEEGPCVLLEDDLCVIYESRPMLCRTHGLPIQLRLEEESPSRDVCPLNFQGDLSLEEIPVDSVLDVGRLDAMLALINQLHDPGEEPSRYPVRETLVTLFPSVDSSQSDPGESPLK